MQCSCEVTTMIDRTMQQSPDLTIEATMNTSFHTYTTVISPLLPTVHTVFAQRDVFNTRRLVTRSVKVSYTEWP
jgi:hypothetical protein